MMMKFYLIIMAIAILLSSCLKQSIPDAMLGIHKQKKITATFSYKINGNQVSISVDDADLQDPSSYTLGCTKSNGYNLDAIGDPYGEFTFTFLTDSLKVGSYRYPSGWGPTYVTNFPGTPNYVVYPTDDLTFNVTTYQNGHVSGNFAGHITPAISISTLYTTYGNPSSVSITNGSFNNVPIFY
jgi:hypothetical protein